MQESGEIRILLVDDHPIVREGLRAVLEAEPGVRVVAEAGSGEEAIRLSGEVKPEVVLMDVIMPGMSGVEAAAAMVRTQPGLVVILLTGHPSKMHLTDVIRAGARGYLLKDAPRRLIVAAIHSALAGGTVVASDLLAQAFAGRSEGADAGPAAGHLSSREIEILQLVSRGLTNREIAQRLHLSEATIKKYLQYLMSKLGAHDRTQAALLGVRLGLIE